jgi:uncharacterized cysteine cluster protein YcgN (CxxCxxCC family)
VRLSLVSKNISTVADDIVVIRHQLTISEDIADWEDFVCAVGYVTQ